MEEQNKILIIGYGTVGKRMKEIFINADIIDIDSGFYLEKDKTTFSYNTAFKTINELSLKWDLAIICVPTPSNGDGSCNITMVEEAINIWSDYVRSFLIKSTVEVGTTEKIRKDIGLPIVFSPEYIGETINHSMKNLNFNNNFLILGGTEDDRNFVFSIYNQFINSEINIYFVDAKTAELCKYMENSFLALKVIFCNEFYDIAKNFGVDYNILRELWTADYRIGKSHTFIYENKRGFDGKCLPKDVKAIQSSVTDKQLNTQLFDFIIERNKYFNSLNKIS